MSGADDSLRLHGVFCATCGGEIERARDGWLEWRRMDDGSSQGPQIVHHYAASPRAGEEGCYDLDSDHGTRASKGPGVPMGFHLHRFVGLYGAENMLHVLVKYQMDREAWANAYSVLHGGGVFARTAEGEPWVEPAQ